MLGTFKNLKQLLDYFADEKNCVEYYEQLRWGGNITCPHCDHAKVYRTNRGYKCASKECYKKFSLTTGTIFENSKIDLRTWFAAIWLASTTSKGISSVNLAAQLGITQKTAWFVLSRIREMLKEQAPDMLLSGTVEADETFVGGKNKNRHANKKVPNSQGRAHIDKTPVVGLIEREGGKVRLFVVPNTDRATLHNVMVSNVQQDSTLITDAYNSYNGLGDRFNHIVVKHSEGNYRTKGAFHTNNIEGFWGIFKRGIIGVYHTVSPKHLQRYCSEYEYRYNNRKDSVAEKFEGAVKTASSTRITYKVLVGK